MTSFGRTPICRSRSTPCWTCFRIRPGLACTSATRKVTPPRTSSRATSAPADSAFCIRLAGMPSGCRPSNMRSRRELIPPRTRRTTSRTSSGRSNPSASRTIGTGRSTRLIPGTSAGPNGSFCSFSGAASPTSTSGRCGGVPNSGPSSRMKKSWTDAAKLAAFPSKDATCGSGSCASRLMPIDCSPISPTSTGPNPPSGCKRRGSDAAREPRSNSNSRPRRWVR